MKSIRIRSYYGPHFPAFGLNTERYRVSLRIQSECGKMRTRITPDMDTFYAVFSKQIRQSESFITIAARTIEFSPFLIKFVKFKNLQILKILFMVYKK